MPNRVMAHIDMAYIAEWPEKAGSRNGTSAAAICFGTCLYARADMCSGMH